MTSLPEPMARLMSALASLPGIGPRSAERIGLHLVQAESEMVRSLAQAILESREKIRNCETCGTLTEKQPCLICTDTARDAATLCIVETAVDVISIEKSGTYRGRYHVLGGKLSPLKGIEPEDLRISQLEQRVANASVRELIIALDADVEGDATSHYLAQRLAGRVASITRLAQGLPSGLGLEFADELTLRRAIEGRRNIQ